MNNPPSHPRASLYAPRWLPALLVFLITTALAESVIHLFRIPQWFIPAPSAVFLAAANHLPTLLHAALFTLLASFIGFALSVLLGILIAVFFSCSKIIERAFYPYAIFFQTVPIVAIAPLLVIWFGFGVQTVAVSAFIVSLFPVIANTLAGLLSTDPALLDLFRLYRGSPWATLFKLRLPAALPNIFTGMRIAAGLSVIGAIVAEFFASSDGLGYIIQLNVTGRNTPLVFAAILLATVLGLLLFATINLAAHLTMRRWHSSELEPS